MREKHIETPSYGIGGLQQADTHTRHVYLKFELCIDSRDVSGPFVLLHAHVQTMLLHDSLM